MKTKIRIYEDEYFPYYGISDREGLVEVDKQVVSRWKRLEKKWKEMQNEMREIFLDQESF